MVLGSALTTALGCARAPVTWARMMASAPLGNSLVQSERPHYNPTIPQSYNPVLAKILHLYQPLIHAVLRHELFMGALFCNGSGLNNNNLIGLLDGA